MPTTHPRQAAEVAALLEERFGDDLAALYLYGSYVDGGLRPQSDIDLLGVLRRPLSAPERSSVMDALLSLSAPPGSASSTRPLELTLIVLSDVTPWRHPARREFQFGEWLRAELQSDSMPPPQTDPDLALLLTQARAKGMSIKGPAPDALLPAVPAEDIRRAIATMLPEVAQNWLGEEKHALLTLARMWITLQTGDIVAKDAAASRVSAQLPAEHRPALERARDVYLGSTPDDWRAWQDRVASCVGHMAGMARRAGWPATPGEEGG
ncbi:aminoglycoside adenylyltransferase family protein [Luteimonas sp. R10]|uniref:aminoglycoside adenylyltransferase family protein n=1 Tax=Luteimonas sp. R10 TaxID=3108176 RepID=UPI00308AD0A7|nr:aminoglycoside adenylyltransferase family protein [Luteimonas sp. R10]